MQLRVEWQVLTQAIISAIIDNSLAIRLEFNNRHKKMLPSGLPSQWEPLHTSPTTIHTHKGNVLTVYKRLYLDRYFLSRGIVKIVGVMCSLCVVSRLQVGFSQPLPRSAEVAYSVRGSFFSLDALRVQLLHLSLLGSSQQAITVLGYGWHHRWGISRQKI